MKPRNMCQSELYPFYLWMNNIYQIFCCSNYAILSIPLYVLRPTKKEAGIRYYNYQVLQTIHIKHSVAARK